MEIIPLAAAGEEIFLGGGTTESWFYICKRIPEGFSHVLFIDFIVLSATLEPESSRVE